MITLILQQTKTSAGEVKVHAHQIQKRHYKIGRKGCMKSPHGDVLG
jgi:hypothetical protein